MAAAEPRFVAPRTLEEALAAHAADGTLALAGGTSLAVLLRSRLVRPTTLVYLARIPELCELRLDAAGLHLGAGCTYRQIARSSEVAEVAPGLGRLAGRIANPRVRAAATLGGALAHADPRQDLPPALLALGATLRLAGPSNTREVPLAGFARGLMDTGLAEDELLVEVLVPVRARRRLACERFTPASEDDFPTVAAAAAVVRDEAGSVAEASLAIGAAGPAPFLVPGADRLAGARDPGADELGALAEAAAAAARPSPDRHGSVAYKQEMVRLHALRALRAALAEA